jgi:hypothetical protein
MGAYLERGGRKDLASERLRPKQADLLRDLSMLSCGTLMKTVAEVQWMIGSRP